MASYAKQAWSVTRARNLVSRNGEETAMAEKTIQDRIEETAAGASEVIIDGQKTIAQPIPDLIAADKHVAAQAAATRSALPIRYAKIRPGSPIG